jgi:hypothetical protein
MENLFPGMSKAKLTIKHNTVYMSKVLMLMILSKPQWLNDVYWSERERENWALWNCVGLVVDRRNDMMIMLVKTHWWKYWMT